MRFKEFFLNEKLITFGNKRPKFGQVVIMAGGAGSGKGFIKDELLGIEGKTLDVDAMKSLVLKSTLYRKKVKEEFGIELDQLDLKNPDNVSTLHNIVSDLKIAKKYNQNLFSSIMMQPEDRKPNIIFDVTLKDVKKLVDISSDVTKLGYKKEDIHIVWVINSVDTALKQNMERERKVNPDILMDTHRGVSQTIRQLLADNEMVKRYLNGDIWFVFNNRFMKDVVKTSSDKGGSYITDAIYLKVKEKGKNITSFEKIDKEIINKIKSYIPKTANW